MEKLTGNEIAFMKETLNYSDRGNQLSDNYSNAGIAEGMQLLNWTASQMKGLVSSLTQKGMGHMDCDEYDIFWLSKKGVNAIFDILESHDDNESKEETSNEKETKENIMNEMNVNAKAVKTVDNFFNGTSGTAIRTGKREYVKQILNRGKAYRISDYVRKLAKDRNVIIDASNVLSSLKRMADEGQIRYEVIGSKVYGYSL